MIFYERIVYLENLIIKDKQKEVFNMEIRSLTGLKTEVKTRICYASFYANSCD